MLRARDIQWTQGWKAGGLQQGRTEGRTEDERRALDTGCLDDVFV